MGWLSSEYDRENEEDEDVEESGMSRIQSHEYMYDHNIEIYRKKTQCRARRVRLLHIVQHVIAWACSHCLLLQSWLSVCVLVWRCRC